MRTRWTGLGAGLAVCVATWTWTERRAEANDSAMGGLSDFVANPTVFDLYVRGEGGYVGGFAFSHKAQDPYATGNQAGLFGGGELGVHVLFVDAYLDLDETNNDGTYLAALLGGGYVLRLPRGETSSDPRFLTTMHFSLTAGYTDVGAPTSVSGYEATRGFLLRARVGLRSCVATIFCGAVEVNPELHDMFGGQAAPDSGGPPGSVSAAGLDLKVLAGLSLRI
jgi:hypothetical protein